jgi:MFS transporter, Spinster family, sphingosine-1-phosphate transporter
MNKKASPRWFVVVVFFVFMLLHQTDKLLIGPMTKPIMDTFKINVFQMGLVSTGALIVGSILYPVWGYLYDRFARNKLLALASFIWGSTTWLNAIAPTYPAFLVTRASTGIDDSSYPGLYSMVSDYFPATLRGKIYGILQLTAPIGYMLGLILGGMMITMLGGWRNIYYFTGALGILLAGVIFFFVKDVPRGQSEKELAGVEGATGYKFNWEAVRKLLKKPTLFFLILQGFFGVFPWNVITYWFFYYLQSERGYTETESTFTMIIPVLILALGYPVGGWLGDALFKRTPRGRIIVAGVGVFLGAVGLYFTMNVPIENRMLFGILLSITAFFIPFASPNVLSTIYDISLPEVRSTANAVESFLENIGAALTPTIAGMIALRLSMQSAIVLICVSTWMVCVFFFIFTGYFIPRDVKALHEELEERARLASAQSGTQAPAEPGMATGG